MPIFCVKSVKIYTGQKKFTRIYPWDPRQIRGMIVMEWIFPSEKSKMCQNNIPPLEISTIPLQRQNIQHIKIFNSSKYLLFPCKDKTFDSSKYLSFPCKDTPKAMLGLGSSLNGSLIKEGDDVYFECRVRYTNPHLRRCIEIFVLCELPLSRIYFWKYFSLRANPRAYKISWRCNVSKSFFQTILRDNFSGYQNKFFSEFYRPQYEKNMLSLKIHNNFIIFILNHLSKWNILWSAFVYNQVSML